MSVQSVQELITNFHDTHSTITSELLFISSLSATINRRMSIGELKKIYGFCKRTLDEAVEKSGKALVQRHSLLACRDLVCVLYKIPDFANENIPNSGLSP